MNKTAFGCFMKKNYNRNAYAFAHANGGLSEILCENLNGLTVGWLARKSNVKAQKIRDFLNGQDSLTLTEIARVFLVFNIILDFKPKFWFDIESQCV